MQLVVRAGGGRALEAVATAILAGGLGTRLRPAVLDRPKVLAKVQGRPFLAYLLDQLVAAGVRYVVLCTGYRGEQVRSAFGGSYGGLHLAYSQEPSLLGTAGALRRALPLLNSSPVMVMNGDSFCDADLRAFWTWHLARGGEAMVLLARVTDAKRYGRVRTSRDGAVVSFVEKGGQGGPGWVNGGVYLLGRRLLLSIPENRTVSLEREIFPAWIGRGLYTYRCPGRFLDIGTPEAYAAAEGFFARGTGAWGSGTS